MGISVRSWVAEHILGHERERCQGKYGGGRVDTDGSIEVFYWCEWCGEKRSGIAPPCPSYPFPEFTLEDLMLALCDKGITIWVRNDPWRDKYKFTVLINGTRLTDTDDPKRALCKWCVEEFG